MLLYKKKTFISDCQFFLLKASAKNTVQTNIIAGPGPPLSPNPSHQWRRQDTGTTRATFRATVATVYKIATVYLQYTLRAVVAPRAMARVARGLDPPLRMNILRRPSLRTES